ncbi:MAG: hypothetical protein IAE99_08035 [Rhodothermales bacterium]|nr:hypothetical protein [Rhodothermales bacterium]
MSDSLTLRWQGHTYRIVWCWRETKVTSLTAASRVFTWDAYEHERLVEDFPGGLYSTIWGLVTAAAEQRTPFDYALGRGLSA